ncbi:deoxyribonuclease IV [Candidatus Uhrbacteria bacterium]|nr:deoxyribonuclease IV [Candidatus Uhrbacteria bacterium]
MFFGAHISAAGGLHNAPENSAKIGGEAFQFFSRPPQGGPARTLDDEAIRLFREAMEQHRQKAAYIHAPYYVNFASSNNRTRYGTIAVVREELERGSVLGVKALMTHLGSANDLLKSGLSAEAAQQRGMQMVIEGVKNILDGYTGSCQLLLEISAGAGLIMGDTFDEIAAIITGVEAGTSKKLNPKPSTLNPRLGVCFDIQHAFASGYDMRTKETQKKVFDEFEKNIGLDRLVVFHCNDSKVEFGSHVDRHADLGDGYIGLPAFEAIVKNKKLQHCDLILETPTEEKRPRDIVVLKKFRKPSI